MEVAEQIVVFNDGRIEQAGPPRDLYESPDNEFVMSFVGPVNRLGDAYIRPHDLDIVLEPDDATVEAMIERIVYLGFEVRVEFKLPDEAPIWMHLSRSQAEELELEEGQIVFVRPRRSTVFESRPQQPATAA